MTTASAFSFGRNFRLYPQVTHILISNFVNLADFVVNVLN